MATTNPYVGPRALEENDYFFGRDREASDLKYLLGSERIVLFYAPSGAGKSSLAQAKLIPELRSRFDVWPITRLNTKPPEGSAANRYCWSAMAGFEKEVPAALGRTPANLEGVSLAQYVSARPRRPQAPTNVLLIFDQFEEIVRVEPLNLAPKREFFEQLGELLVQPKVWALFLLREDYLAPLDPYLPNVPTRFRNRYRMDLLMLDQAHDAIAFPAAQQGRTFTPEAITLLLQDLATVQVQRADGQFEQQTGTHVEPMHLQIVCRTLWDKLPAGQATVGPKDVEAFGEVTKVLAGYYAGEVQKAAGDAATERTVRRWIEEKLIIAGSVRNQVMRTADASQGLNEVIGRLVDSHLIREEQRANARWYELAHDRLIRPVLVNNKQWFEQNLAKTQRAAELWTKQQEPVGLLLSGQELVEALEWAKAQPDLTSDEKRFLEESQKAASIAEREKRQQKRIRTLAVVSTIGGIVALTLAITAGFIAVYAKRKERESLSLALAARSQYQSADKKLSVLLALYALTEACTREAREALIAAAQNDAGPHFAGHTQAVTGIDIGPAHQLLASASLDGTLRIWNIDSGRQQATFQAPADSSGLSGVCFVNKNQLAVSANDGSIVFVHPNGQLISSLGRNASGSAPARDVDCSPSHDLVAVASDAQSATPWMAQDAATHISEFFIPKANRVAFNPSGNLVAAAGKDGTVTIWSVATRSLQQSFHQFSKAATCVRFSPDGSLLAAGADDDTIFLWRTANWQPLRKTKATGLNGVLALTFSPDGQTLATVGRNGSGRLWRVPGLGESLALPKVSKETQAVAYVAPRDGRIIVGSADSNIYLYDLKTQRLAERALRSPGTPDRLNDRQCQAFLGSSSCEPIHLPLQCEDQ